jgi:thiol-disulfide isomerase/thioredoxin
MTPGVGVLAGALAIALIGGVAWRLTNGRMRSPRAARPGRPARPGPGSSVPLSRRVLQEAGVQVPAASPAGGPARQDPAPDHDTGETGIAARMSGTPLTSDQLGHPLGARATLVQFSSAFCAPCRATRRILADVAAMTAGVAHIEIDAESRLDLVRQLNVLRTPTVLVLSSDGQIVRRASGQPRKADVIAAIGAAIEPQPQV